MAAFTEIFVRPKIGTRITAWFLAITVSSCVILAWLTYRLSSDSLEHTVREGLLVIAADKARQVETFALERIHSVSALSSAPSVADAMSAFTSALASGGPNSPAYQAAET